MELAEVSRSIGELAAAINKKSQELDKLKSDYDRKLRLIDSYISHFPSEENSLQEPDEFVKHLQSLKEPVTCPHCDKTLFDIQQPTDFVLIPKSRLKLPVLDVKSSCHKPDDHVASFSKLHVSSPFLHQITSPTTLEAQETPQTSEIKSKNKSKRTCSYCNKTGHTRAKCFTRLVREK